MLSRPVILVVVDDRHAMPAAHAALQRRRLTDATAAVVFLTSDALLALSLRREGRTSILDVDDLDRDGVLARDRLAVDSVEAAFTNASGDQSIIGGVRYAPLFAYTVVPRIMQAIRHLHAVRRAIASTTPVKVVLVSHGPLTRAAALVAAASGVPIDRAAGGPWRRIRLVFERLFAGRHVLWVGTTFRALILEPSVLALLSLRGFFSSVPRADGAARSRPTLIVTGDRFTHDLLALAGQRVERVIVAGATLPGRKLFLRAPGVVQLESFGRILVDLPSAIGRMATGAARALRLLREPPDGCRFDGIDYWTLIAASAAGHLAVWPAILGHQSRLIARAVAGGRGQLLVSNDVTAYNRTLINAARAAGAVSLGIQHGLGEANVHSQVRTDTLAAWGPSSERWFKAHGNDGSRFVMTGNPRLDPLARRLLNRGPTSCTAPRAPGAPFTVLVCTGFVGYHSTGASEMENLLMLGSVLEWARRRPDTFVLHKLHPGEEPSHYREVSAALGWMDLRSVRDAVLYDLIDQSDVMVAAYSTTVLEAAALGTPAVVLDAITKCHALPLDESPDITIASSVPELGAALDRIREGRNGSATADQLRRAFLDDYLFKLDGHATDRVAALLLSGSD